MSNSLEQEAQMLSERICGLERNAMFGSKCAELVLAAMVKAVAAKDGQIHFAGSALRLKDERIAELERELALYKERYGEVDSPDSR